MLCKYEIELDIKEEKNYKIYNWGSLLQGVIMESINSEYAEKLHNMKINTYTQYVYLREDNEYVWVISTLDNEAYNNIIENYINKVDSVYVKHKNLEIKFKSKKEVSKIEIDELFKKWYFNEEINNRVKIKILTPVSYKNMDGQYQIIPSIEYIIPNIINRWNAIAGFNQMDKEVVDKYIERTYIEKYNLKSVKFGLEGMNINSFIGSLTLKINANDTMINLLNMLFEFAEYSGIGIKVSMGMGGIKYEK